MLVKAEERLRNECVTVSSKCEIYIYNSTWEQRFAKRRRISSIVLLESFINEFISFANLPLVSFFYVAVFQLLQLCRFS